jgi:hypothetical protein
MDEIRMLSHSIKPNWSVKDYQIVGSADNRDKEEWKEKMVCGEKRRDLIAST